MADHVAGTLCYVLGPITGVLFLVLEPYRRKRNVRFHALQSILFSAAYMVIYFAVAVVFPFGVGILLAQLVAIAAIGLWLYLMWKTYQNQRVVLPVIGSIAEKEL